MNICIDENEFAHKRNKQYFWKTPAARQTFIISGIMSLMFSTGIGMGTATVMLPQLKQNRDEILVDESMASWIFSAHGFGSVPAVLIAPYLSQSKGYKFAFLLSCIPMLSAFILQYFATSAFHLLLVAILQGVTQGSTITVGIIAITEYAEPRLRGLFLIMKSAAYFWGIWIANIIGTFSYWRYIPLFGICPVLFSLTSCFAWREGPYWLASVGRIEECKNSFQWLRGPGNGHEELSCINKKYIDKTKPLKKSNLLTNIREVVFLRQFYMPVIINCTLLSLYHATGKIVVTVYALVIIKEITKNETTAYIGMLIIDGVTVLGMYVGSYVAMRVKRRVIYLCTSGATIIFLYILFIYLSLVEYEVVSQNAIVSLSLLLLYSFCVCCGPMVLSTSFLSEITPMRFKYVIVSIGSALFWCLHLLSIKLSPFLFKNIGMRGSFGVYGTLTLICWIYLYIYLPETYNKTLEEMENIFVKDVNKGNGGNDNENEVML